MEQAITLSQFNRRIVDAMATPALRSVWVTAETVDVRVSNGHMYMELIEKDDAGATVARIGASIWASNLARLNAVFFAATGSRIASGMKVMVRASATFHAVYGLRAVISDINPEYTLGDLLRRRREILARLAAEGVADMNRSLPAPRPLLRVAVVSAPGAAGLGDFLHQLASTPARLRFTTRFFEATMQGDRAPRSIIAALERVAEHADELDAVVIIRGGGATSDLATLDNYDLAANVAQFPLPVIVGVGHERDTTVLDAVAWMSVKTPTAAAEWLIARGTDELDALRRLAAETARLSAARLGAALRSIDYMAAQLPQLAAAHIMRGHARLDAAAREIPLLAAQSMAQRRQRLAALADLIEALSPAATLRRGYSVLRVDGHAVTSPEQIAPGATVEATMAGGKTNLKHI
ncbi:MAG: exodeoxyribonuclease VII large subunit [Muribaculaceae bacterium]|nr:exodeoxyribonuclease VII large subunit [Muribaculaceae bacterium]